MNRIITILFMLLFVSFANSQINPKYSKWKTGSFFRGYNILYESGHTPNDFSDYRDLGGRYFQIGTFAWMKEDPPYNVQQSNIDSCDRYVGYCKQYGIYYTIAVRSGPGAYDTYLESQGLTGESRIWNTGNTSEQQLYSTMLNMIVSRYQNDSLFAGIDLVVEPRPKVRSIPANNSALYKTFLENVYNIYMDRVYESFIASIRSIDNQIPIIIENFAYSTPELFPAYVITDPYIVYSTHNYMPKEYTNSNHKYKVVYPGTYWNITYLSQKLYNSKFLRQTIFSKVHDFQVTTSSPIIIGELGMMYPQKGASTYLGDVFEIAKSYGWQWAIWDWRRSNGMVWNIENFANDTFPVYNAAWITVLRYLNTPPSTTLNFSAINSNSENTLELETNNFPNPFNPYTTIQYSIKKGSNINLTVFDIRGRKISILENEYKEAGSYSIKFDGTNLSSGIYFYKLNVISKDGYQNSSLIRRMILTK